MGISSTAAAVAGPAAIAGPAAAVTGGPPLAGSAAVAGPAAAVTGGPPLASRPPARAAWRSTARIGLALAVVATLVGSITLAMRTPPPAPAPSAPAPSVLPAVPVLFEPVALAPQPAAAVAAATTLDVPRLRISRSSLVALGVDGAGVLIPPTSTAVAGWFTGSAVPGAVGPTVIAGHVDSYAGPGIFYRLDTLRPGDLISVGRSDGVTVRYRVTDVTTFPKDQFPTRQVYGPTPGPELRLITCGGEFDRAGRRYLSNVVVSANAY